MIRTNLTERLLEGRQLARKEHKEQDKKKLGNLRAGNSGIMSEQGDFAGACPRVAHLRSLGLDVEEPSDPTLIMFQMGTANEEVVFQDLLKTKAEDEVILREEEIPIEWFTKNGTKVTGRPDMVVCRKKDWIVTEEEAAQLAQGYPHDLEAGSVVPGALSEPLFGIEIKGVFSVWTSREVLFDGNPKMAHLIQAAHYSWQLGKTGVVAEGTSSSSGLPFKLLYKQYGNQAVPQWAGKFFPKKGESHSEHIEYNEKGDIKNINPFEIIYELEFDSSGFLKYRREGSSRWVRTMIRTQDIERYYEFVSTMPETGLLGNRPITMDSRGKEKSYSNCSYCALKSVCDSSEKKGYPVWLQEVKKELLNARSKAEV